MISRVHSSILQGIDAVGCEVEAHVVSSDNPDIKLVGLADKAVQESVSRVQAALHDSGYHWPGPKVTIRLAPADAKKDSAAFGPPTGLHLPDRRRAVRHGEDRQVPAAAASVRSRVSGTCLPDLPHLPLPAAPKGKGVCEFFSWQGAGMCIRPRLPPYPAHD